MRNFKKVVAMTLVAASTASLAACGGSGKDSDGKKTITLAWWGTDGRNKATEAAVKKFEELHPDIKVNCDFAAWDGYEERMAAKFSSNTQADINQINWGWIDQYDKKGKLFLDLNKVKDTLDLTQYDEKFLKLCKYENEIEAVPVAMTGRIFYWNTDTFQKAGAKIPTTYEELKEAGTKFKALGDDYYPLVLNELDRTLLMRFYLESTFGREWVTDNKLNYSAEEIQKGFEFIKELEDAHVIPTMKKLKGDGAKTIDINPNWINGNYGGIFEWDSAAAKYKEALQNKEAFVVGDEIKFGTTNGGFSKISLAFAISENTKYPTECAQLLQFLLNEEAGVKELGLQRGTPISKKAKTTLDAAGILKDDMVTQANNKVMEFVSYSMDPKFENSKLKGANGAYYKAAEDVSYGSMTPEAAGKYLVDQINEVLEGK